MITVTAKVFVIAVFTGALFGQGLSNSSFTGVLSSFTNSALNGTYYVRHVQFTTDTSNNVTDARSITGSITFDGMGNYSFSGQQVIGTGAATNYSVNGTYSMQPTGALTLTNPQTATATVNARFGVEAVVGSSTEVSTNTFDFFVAIPAPGPSVIDTNSTLAVSYVFADWELTGASTAQVRNAAGTFQFDGQGNISISKIVGHGASILNGASQNQSGYSGTYSLNGNGTGTLIMQIPSGQSTANSLMAGGPRNLAVSASGNIFIASTPGAHDILIGLHDAATDNITIGNFAGRYWFAGIETDSGGSSDNTVGALLVNTADSTAVFQQREHQSSSPQLLDFSAASSYVLGSSKNGTVFVSAGAAVLALGNNSTLLAADFGEDLASSQAAGEDTFNITLGVGIPALTGSGVYVNPQGILNAASEAPVGAPISPGEFIVIYGSGLASTAMSQSPPYTDSLDGVSVSIGGLPAPIYAVSASQINCIVPYGVSTTGGPVPIIVTNGSATSNTVLQPIGATAPGVFSLDQTGAGAGAVAHNATGELVSATNPAVAGEALVVYLTGLGALQAPVADGQASGSADNAVVFPGGVLVQVDGVTASTIYYAGINPVFPGLYQVDFQMPQIPDHGQEVNLLIGAQSGTQVEATEIVTLYAQ